MHQSDRNGFNAGHVLLALMGGAIAGAGVAYLTAPAAGRETRHRVRLMAQDTNETVKHLPDAVRRASEAARDAFVEALELEEGESSMGKNRGQKAVAAGGNKSKRDREAQADA
jgi:gas vesicle protein